MTSCILTATESPSTVTVKCSPSFFGHETTQPCSSRAKNKAFMIRRARGNCWRETRRCSEVWEPSKDAFARQRSACPNRSYRTFIGAAR